MKLLRDFMDETDREAEAQLHAAGEAFGHPMEWPLPLRVMPRWYQFRQKRHLRTLEKWFGPICQDDLDAFWVESGKGQSVYEDAGGYMLRCYRALVALQTDDPYTYQQAAADLLAERALGGDA